MRRALRFPRPAFDDVLRAHGEDAARVHACRAFDVTGSDATSRVVRVFEALLIASHLTPDRRSLARVAVPALGEHGYEAFGVTCPHGVPLVGEQARAFVAHQWGAPAFAAKAAREPVTADDFAAGVRGEHGVLFALLSHGTEIALLERRAACPSAFVAARELWFWPLP